MLIDHEYDAYNEGHVVRKLAITNMPSVETFEVRSDKLNVNRIDINRICSSQI
jgi:hypothetical protein